MNATIAQVGALHRAMLLDPGDALARLAYADALDEAGDWRQARWVRGGSQLPPIIHAPGCLTPWRCGHTELNPGREPGGPAWHWKGVLVAVAVPFEDFMRDCRDIFTAQPVTQVWLTDRTPHAPVQRLHGWLGWNPGDGPFCVGQFFRGLPRASRRPVWLSGGKWYRTEHLARRALSASCVKWGRRKAGLPALPPERRDG